MNSLNNNALANFAFLKLTLLQLLRNKRAFSIYSIIGLGIGLACYVFVLFYLAFDRSYDTCYPDHDKIYRINSIITENATNTTISANTPLILWWKIKTELKGMPHACRIAFEKSLIRHESQIIGNKNVLWVDADFMDIFGIETIKGTAKLNIGNTCIISQEFARQIFGDTDPIGKILYINERMPHEITAIYKKPASNSQISYDLYVSIKTWFDRGLFKYPGTWHGPQFYTYIKAENGISNSIINNELVRLSKEYNANLNQSKKKVDFVCEPISQTHYNNDTKCRMITVTSKKNMLVLRFVSVLLVIIAFLNYLNFAKANNKINMHKFDTKIRLGASKILMLCEIWIQSLGVFLVSTFISMILFFAFIQPFQTVFAIPISAANINYLAIGAELFFVVILLSIVGTLINSMPLFNQLYHRNLNTGKPSKTPVLDGIIVFQMVVSIVLLAFIVFIHKQITFLKNADKGLNLQNVIVLNGPPSNNMSKERAGFYKAFSDEIMTDNQFVSKSAFLDMPGEIITWRDVQYVNDKISDRPSTIETGNIDEGYIETLGLKLLAGRNFDIQSGNLVNQLLITDSGAKTLGYSSPEDAVGQQVKVFGTQNYLTVVGVINDYYQEGMHKKMAPKVFRYRHPFHFGYYAFRYTGTESTVIAKLEHLWQKHFPKDPFSYFFADKFYEQAYKPFEKSASLFSVFTVVIFLIAIMGLIGLQYFVLQNRKKEIAIRRVNGSKIWQLLQYFNKKYLTLILLAFIVAMPLSIFLLNNYLNDFASKTPISLEIYILSGVIPLIITLLTVSWQSWRAATRNPVEALRSE